MDLSNYYNMFLVAVVSLLAAISPGPDFFIVVRNSLVYSRKAGILTSFGVATALIIHLSYTILGIGVLIAENSIVYNFVKYCGAAYLFYIGFSGVRSSFVAASSLTLDCQKSSYQISSLNALKQGFLTNLLNPKCAIFFISLFSQFITAETPLFVRVEYALVNWVMSIGWFLVLTYLITGKFLSQRVDRFRSYIDRIMGSCLMVLSLKLLFV